MGFVFTIRSQSPQSTIHLEDPTVREQFQAETRLRLCDSVWDAGDQRQNSPQCRVSTARCWPPTRAEPSPIYIYIVISIEMCHMNKIGSPSLKMIHLTLEKTHQIDLIWK